MWFIKMIEEELKRRSLARKIKADFEFAKQNVELLGYLPNQNGPDCAWIVAVLRPGTFINKQF